LARLFASFQGISTPAALLIVDNADDPETKAVVDSVQQGRFEVVRLVPGTNLGCGGGLAFGENAALERYAGRLTHLWLLDDDTELAPSALEQLLAAMQSEGAALACPMIINAEREIDWFPGLLKRREFNAIRNKRVRTPAEYLASFGAKPVRFNWATGVSLLITREAMEEVGAHRDDFWIRGEDLEFSLRITAGMPGIFVPGAVVSHLPPSVSHSHQTLAAEQKKEVAKLQNIAFISLHLPHGRRILRTLPGNYFRHVRLWGLKSLLEALGAFWRGGVRALPAGARTQ